MLEKLFHLITGSVQFTVQGESARFFNTAARSGFGFWGFSHRGETAAASCRAAEYRRLLPLARRCRVRLRCVKKRGIPFQTEKLLRRKGLLAGILCGMGIYWLLSGSFWVVTVTGTEALGEKTVLKAAMECGIYPGAGKSSFSPQQASHELISRLPELQWATVNTDGCFAEISVREKAVVPEMTDDSEWSNIMAARDGVILGIEAECGRQEVKIGDTVREGELLIAGLYKEIPDPYSPQPAELPEIWGAARGSVTAETYREFTILVSDTKRETVSAGKQKRNTSLILFGLKLPLGFHTAPEGECRIYRKRQDLTALGTVLPAALEQEIWEPLEEKERKLSREEQKEEALFKLRQAQKASIAPGGSVLREDITYSFSEGSCVLTAQCRCKEEIGVQKKVLVNKTNLEDNF